MKSTRFSLGSSVKKSSRKIILIVCLVIVVLAGAGTYVYMKHRGNDSAVKETSEPDAPPPEKAASETSNDSIEDDKPIVTQYQGESVNNSPTLTGVLNYKAVVDDKLSIRVTIDQAVSSGVCNLTLTNQSSGKTVAKTAQTVQNPSSASCMGFDVPLAELGSGAWNIVIEITGDGKTGKITGDINL